MSAERAHDDAAHRYDERYLAELRARIGLADTVARRVRLRRKGQEHAGLCPFHNEKTPSFTVSEAKGFFHCFGCGAHGDVIGFVMRSEHLGFREAVELLSGGVGLAPRYATGQPQGLEEREPDLDAAADARKRQAKALAIWRESRPAAGTVVEAYLRSRSITLPIPPSIRFHPALKYMRTGMVFPAMVAAVQAPDRRITAMHRTYLRPDGRGKAEIESPKMALGPLGRGAVHLGPSAAVMGIAEGIETGLSAQQLHGVATWAALGCRLDQIEPPFAAAHLVIFRDNGEVGKRAAERVRDAQRNQGRRISIKAPFGSFKDWNDVLRARSEAAGPSP